MSKKTEWFPADIKPVREGIYQTRTLNWPLDRFLWWRYFDGKKWCVGTTSKESALDNRDLALRFDSVIWRGLAKPD